MKKYLSPVLIVTLLTLLIFDTSCKGQIGREVPNVNVSGSKTISELQPKLIKTQGSQMGDNVNNILEDKTGNLWFGTTSEGLYKYDRKTFTQFTVTNGLISNNINSIFEDKEGKIWIGTEAGVCIYDGKTFSKVHIPLRKNMPLNKVRNTHNVFSIMQDKSGKLWFATIDGVYIYDGKTFTPFIIDEGVSGFMSSNHNVEYILEDNAGIIWFGGRNNEGVFRYDGKSLTNLKVDEQKDFNWAWPVLQDRSGNIWFSNWNGAYRYDGKSFTKNTGLAAGPVTRIIESKDGSLWFGGGGRGICRYDGKTFACLSTKDGLINNDVWSILEDRDGNVWVGTRNTGLYCYDGKAFINFSETKE